MAGTDQLSAVFSALSDPTRRAIIAELAARDMVSVPVHPGLTDDDRVAVASALNRLAALELWAI